MFGRKTAQIISLLQQLGVKMTNVETNQQHLDADETALAAAVATAVAELKAAIAAGTAPEALDFTALDALVSTEQAEAAADARAAPTA